MPIESFDRYVELLRLRVVDGQVMHHVEEYPSLFVFEHLDTVLVGYVQWDAAEVVFVGVQTGTVHGDYPQPSFRVTEEVVDLVVRQVQRVVRTVILVIFVYIVFV